MVTASTASACSEVSSVGSGPSGARSSHTAMPRDFEYARTAAETEKGQRTLILKQPIY